MFYSDRNNFAPRIGLALRPFGHTKSVVRAGYGIFYHVAPLQPTGGGSPFKLTEPTFVNPATRPGLVWPLAYPTAGVTPSAVAFPSFTSRDVRFAEPYTQQWNFTLEQQVVSTGIRLSYIGTVTRLMEYVRDANSPAPNSTPYIQKPRPLPGFAAITLTENGSSHTYHAFQVEAERQFSNGLYYQVGHTWAKDMGDPCPSVAHSISLPRGNNSPQNGMARFGHGWTRMHADLDQVFGGEFDYAQLGLGLFLQPALLLH